MQNTYGRLLLTRITMLASHIPDVIIIFSLEQIMVNKLAATLLKKRLWHICFPVNFAKFQRTPFLQNTYKRLC